MNISTPVNNGLTPALTTKKKYAEEIGYRVEKRYDGTWVVRPTGSVQFLMLQAPSRKAYKLIHLSKFNDDHDAMMEFWDTLDDDRRYSPGDPKNGAPMYEVDLDRKARWEEYEGAQERFKELVFDSSETRALFEVYLERYKEFDEDYFTCWLNTVFDITRIKTDDGRIEYYGEERSSATEVFAIRYFGPLPEMSFEGFQVTIIREIELNVYGENTRAECELPEVHELPSVKIRELRKKILRAKHPDAYVSFDPERLTDSEVEWVIPGLVETGGFTLTFAKESLGKTALVMSELWLASQRKDCNVLYIAFENHNGLVARCGALESKYGPAPSFVTEKATWDLADLGQWSHVVELIEDWKAIFADEGDLPLVVVFDTVGAAILEGSRITGGVEHFYGGLRQTIRKTGVAAWVIAHANDAGDVFGFKGAKHDADVVTKVTRRSNGKQHVHTRVKGRHATQGERLCVFQLEVLNGVPVAVKDGDTEAGPEAAANVDEYPDLPDRYKPLIGLLEDAGAEDGLTNDELRDVLNGFCHKKDAKPDTIRKQRHRAKVALIEAKVLIGGECGFFLTT